MSAPNSSMTAQPATSEASSALPIISAPSVAPDTAPSAAQARAAQRKELQLKRQAHATTGVMEQAHMIPAGREIVPQPNAAARDKAKSSAGQAQVAAQQTLAAAQPATPTLAAQAPADAQGAPSTQAVNAPQDSAVKRTEDPKGSSHGAGANSGLRARETFAAELAQRRALKQKELRRKHNKEARKQRKNANRRK